MHSDTHRSSTDVPLQKCKCNLRATGPAVVTRGRGDTILIPWLPGKLDPGVPVSGVPSHSWGCCCYLHPASKSQPLCAPLPALPQAQLHAPPHQPSPYRAEVGGETERGGAIEVDGEQVLEVQRGLQRPGRQGQGGQQGAGGTGGRACCRRKKGRV